MKKSKNVILVVVVLAALAVTAVTLYLAVGFFRKPTIDLNKYTVLKFEGYDGSGKAEVSLDRDSINKDYGDRVRVDFDQTLLNFLYEGATVGSVLDYWTTLSLDRKSDLSNGDVVTVTYTADTAYLEGILNCRLSCEEKKFTVEGLQEIGLVDVFDGVELSYTGTAPAAQAKVIADNPYGSDAYGMYDFYQVTPQSGLSNGDEVTVTFQIDNEEAFLEEFGGLPRATEKKFTVEGLDSYITDLSQLTKENMQALTQEAQDQMEAECASNSYLIQLLIGDTHVSDDISIESDFNLENIYFLLGKNESAFGYPEHAGRVILVYSVSISTIDYKGDYCHSGKIYFSVAFTDLVLEENGSIVGVSANRTESYDSLDAAYKKWVTENKDHYTITVYDSDLKKAE